MELRQLDISAKDNISAFFADIFMRDPWNDDWSDAAQLDAYITDLIGNPTSLTLAMLDGECITALAMGNIRHWFAGTVYYIDEFCVKTELQGKGVGTEFLCEIREYLKKINVAQIFLQTDSKTPAYQFYLKNGFNCLTTHVSLELNI